MRSIAIAEQPKLGTITRKIYHDCVKPEIEPIETKTYMKGHLWWKKEHTYHLWSKDSFDFTCVCGTKWRYSGGTYGGHWYCDDRKYTTVTETV